ncbi:ketosynthase [Luteimonas sp. Y-2-2-4F]|nr:ketosynthase [Luteimonas sp. Y-2-2-4F]MCD9032823.1 ketosynthase [Luteimonas sp. Y-2-2-4F]
MVLIVEIVLAVAYGLLAHLAAAWRSDALSLAALLSLVALLLAAPLAARRGWAWLSLAPLVAAACWLYAAGHAGIPLLLVPVAFIGLIAWVFGRTLRAGRQPLIGRIVGALEGRPGEPLAPELAAYTRALTAAWAWLLGLLALFNLFLATIAVPDGLLASLGVAPPVSITRTQWSWFANLLNYGVVLGMFAGEYAYRARRFPGRYAGFGDFLRRMGALGPAFWRDLLR